MMMADGRLSANPFASGERTAANILDQMHRGPAPLWNAAERRRA
jgi:hypothetical protein